MHPGPSRRFGGNRLTVKKGCRIQDVTWLREAPKMPNVLDEVGRKQGSVGEGAFVQNPRF